MPWTKAQASRRGNNQHIFFTEYKSFIQTNNIMTISERLGLFVTIAASLFLNGVQAHGDIEVCLANFLSADTDDDL